MDLNSNFLYFSFESYITATGTLYTRQKRSNGLQKRFGDVKRTPLREVSNFIVAFQRENRNSFTTIFKSIQALISISYSTLWLLVVTAF